MSVDAADFRRMPFYPRATGPLLAATGLTVWTALSIWAAIGPHEPAFGIREAWNTNAYFLLGLPFMAAAVGVAAYQIPERCWRWPLWLVAGHQIGMMLGGLGMQSGLSLVILALIIATLLAALFAIPALIGGHLARRHRFRRSESEEFHVPQPVQAIQYGVPNRPSQTAPARSAFAGSRKSPPRSRKASRRATAAQSGNR